jgi:hypothetical protein
MDLTEQKIKGLLSERHPPEQWIFWTELENSVEKKGYRRIDAYAINRKNLTCIAYEIKTSKADFYAELADPTKRQPFIDASSEFYFVAPLELIPTSEIPDDCGLIEAGNLALSVKRGATHRNLTSIPVEFIAAMFSSVDKRSIQDWPLFHLAGKQLSLIDLASFIKEGAHEYRQRVLQQLKEEVDLKYVASLPEKDQVIRKRV